MKALFVSSAILVGITPAVSRQAADAISPDIFQTTVNVQIAAGNSNAHLDRAI